MNKKNNVEDKEEIDEPLIEAEPSTIMDLLEKNIEPKPISPYADENDCDDDSEIFEETETSLRNLNSLDLRTNTFGISLSSGRLPMEELLVILELLYRKYVSKEDNKKQENKNYIN